MSNKIKIKDCISKYKSLGLGRETGKQVRTELEDKLIKNNEIVLDFKDVSMLTNSFIDELIGKKIKEIGLDEFKKSIHIINCNDNIKETIKFNVNSRINN